MKFDIPSIPDEIADDFVRSQTRKYNADFVPDEFEPLSVYCRNDDGVIIGGLTAKTYWNYLDISFLWVDDQHRGNGVASQIIKLAEDKARERGCSVSMLDTFEFQALGFYQKQGLSLIHI